MDRSLLHALSTTLSRRELLRVAAATGVTLPLALAIEPLLPRAAAAAMTPKKTIADVLRFSTKPQGWKGLFGFVTFRLHAAYVDGQRAYHIRTDSADQAFAKQVGLVYVPRVNTALRSGDFAEYFVVTNGTPGQLPVAGTAPGKDDYTPLFRISRVSFARNPRTLTSVAQIKDAASNGRVRITETKILVNYPFVRWPGGELSRDTKREVYLGDGQLLERPDAGRRMVTFKLHQCFPGEWYIVTDTSATPMAPMMRIAPAPKTAGLTKAGATAKILVFGNGIKGAGPMGFQPSVVDSLPGHPLWSPFWDHYTFTWNDGKTAGVLKNQDEIVAAEKAGGVKRWPGTPDTNGQTFVVNCPVPVTAPMTWTGG